MTLPISGTYNGGSVDPETGELPTDLNYPENPELTTIEEQFQEDFRKLMVVATPQNFIFANYFADRGDTRIKDKIVSVVSTFIKTYKMTPETIINDIDMALQMNYYTQDEDLQELIYNEAMKEIEGEV